MSTNERLTHFPVSFFSMILGLAGFTIALQKAEAVLGLPTHIAPYALAFTGGTFIVLLGIYLFKWAQYPAAVKAEFAHPIKLSFFPTISISFLLGSVATLEWNAQWSKYLWIVGAGLHLAFTLRVVSIWIHHEKFEIHHMNPSWFIPAVGNILVPIAGVVHGPAEVNWFFFSIGLVFWIILLVIFFNRIIFHHPLPQKLFPTLFILIAPPAIGFVSAVKLMGELSYFGMILYYTALFFTLLLLVQFDRFRKIQFFLSWWAYSFPLAAITISTVLMLHLTENVMFLYFARVFFGLLTAVILLLLYKTIKAVITKKICVPE